MKLIQALMQRDNISADDAQDIIDEMKEQVLAGEDPEEVLFNEGFEPDYIFDIL